MRFSWQEQIQKLNLFKYYTERTKKNFWTKLSSLGQEPTFKAGIWVRIMIFRHCASLFLNVHCHAEVN